VLNVLFEEFNGLCKKFVTFTEVVGLLVAACYIIRHDTDEYRLNQNPLLLMLNRKDFECFLKCAQRFMQVALLFFSGVVVGGGECSVLRIWLLQCCLLYF